MIAGATGAVGKMCSGGPGAWEHDGDPGGESAGVVAACCELANLAIQVDPAKPPLYFIDNVGGLKQAMATVAARAIGDPTSRTEPALALAAPTIQKTQNPMRQVLARRNSPRLRSSCSRRCPSGNRPGHRAARPTFRRGGEAFSNVAD